MFAVYFGQIVHWLERGLFLAVAAAALVGLIMVLTTREDAFAAADRQPKMVWAAILGGSFMAMLFYLPFLAWIGAVATGVYWFDIRPQIKEILNGNYGY